MSSPYSNERNHNDYYDRYDVDHHRSRRYDDGRYGGYDDNDRLDDRYDYDRTRRQPQPHYEDAYNGEQQQHRHHRRENGSFKDDSLYPDPEEIIDVPDNIDLRRTFRRGPGVVEHFDHPYASSSPKPYDNYSPRSIRDLGYSAQDRRSARDLMKHAPPPLDERVYEGRSIYEEKAYEEKQRRLPSHKRSATMIEIEPGVEAPLRGADETYRAIKQDFYVPTECLCCGDCIFCIQDAEFVLCPGCRVVSPLIGAEGDSNGVGLGFTIDDLARWQEDILRDNTREQRRQAKESMQRNPRNRW